MHGQRRTDTTFACPAVGWRETARLQYLHRDKVEAATAHVDTRPPRPQPHLEWGRNYAVSKAAAEAATSSDAKMLKSITRIMMRRPRTPERKGPVSLNVEARRQEFLRVAQENRRLAGKIASPKPTICTRDLLREHSRQRAYGIRASHAKRYAGEYDGELARMREETRRARLEAQERFAHAAEFLRAFSEEEVSVGFSAPAPLRPRSASCATGAHRHAAPPLAPWATESWAVAAASAAQASAAARCRTIDEEPAAPLLPVTEEHLRPRPRPASAPSARWPAGKQHQPLRAEEELGHAQEEGEEHAKEQAEEQAEEEAEQQHWFVLPPGQPAVTERLTPPGVSPAGAVAEEAQLAAQEQVAAPMAAAGAEAGAGPLRRIVEIEV